MTSMLILLIHKLNEIKFIKDYKEKYQSLVEVSSDWIWEVNPSGNYTYCSPKVEELLGYKPEEIIGKTPFDLMEKNESDKLRKIFDKLLETQEPFNGLENRNIHKDGRYVVLESNGVPLFDKTGNLIGYRGIDRDITDFKKKQNILNDKNNKLRIAQKLGKLSWWEYDIDDDSLTWPEETYDLFGLDPKSNISSKTIKELILPEFHEYHINMVKQVIKQGRGEWQYPIIGNDNIARWILTNAETEYNEEGGPVRMFGTIQDITEPKQIEQDREKLIKEMEKVINEIKTLKGIIPICSHCRKIRDDRGYWKQFEAYVQENSNAEFSHSICQECAKKYYGDIIENE
ncbi:MAG: PAS domain S-box protein [Desulfobacterales bacterium]|nr:PAS domain S-box protein [Desulfobacterales bacterium]